MKIFRGVGYETQETGWFLLLRALTNKWGSQVGDVVVYTARPKCSEVHLCSNYIPAFVREHADVPGSLYGPIDGIPWEIHAIVDPIAYEAALTAYMANST